NARSCRRGIYESPDVAKTDARRALPEPAAQRHVRDRRSRSRRVRLLRQVRLDGVLVRGDAARLRARRRSRTAPLLHRRAELLQALTTDSAVALRLLQFDVLLA